MNGRQTFLLFLFPLLLWFSACDSTRAETAPLYQGPIDGLDLSDFKGRVVVLNFWATWCGPCRIEIPDLVRLRQDFSAEDVAIIGVSVDKSRDTVALDDKLEQFIDSNQINYPIYLDPQGESLGAAYDPTGTMRYVPTTVIIDQRGEIHDTHFGVPRNASGQVDPYSVLGAQIQGLLDSA
jgi:peroxiredoxin